jgi:hypothetical protein
VKLFSCAFVAPSFYSSVLVSGIIGQPGRESERRLHEIWRFGLGLTILSLAAMTAVTQGRQRQWLAVDNNS